MRMRSGEKEEEQGYSWQEKCPHDQLLLPLLLLMMMMMMMLMLLLLVVVVVG